MTRVSLAELASAGFVLHSAEAAAIVVEVCRQYSSGLLPGIPSAHVIRLTPDGSVVAEGPITTDHPPLAKAAHLLNELLPPFGAPPAYRVPGGLRLVVARALGTLDLPPFESLDAFGSAIARFAVADLTSTAQSLYRAWEYAREPPVPTISDLRRARRATGLSLEDISTACGVPTPLLRQLEWGYLKNWRDDANARTWLTAYATASGLDEQLVTSIVVPMLEGADPQEEAHRQEEARPQEEAHPQEDEREETALVPAGPQALVRCEVVRTFRPKNTRTILRASASAAAIALVAYAATMGRAKAIEMRAGSLRDFVPDFISADAPLERMAPPLPVHLVSRVQPVQARPAPPSHVSKARFPAKHAFAAPAPTKKPAKPNFFKRQLLRIIIVK